MCSDFFHQVNAVKIDIEKTIGKLNFKSKSARIPEDKRILRSLNTTIELMEKSSREMNEQLLKKIQNFPKTPKSEANFVIKENKENTGTN